MSDYDAEAEARTVFARLAWRATTPKTCRDIDRLDALKDALRRAYDAGVAAERARVLAICDAYASDAEMLASREGHVALDLADAIRKGEP